MVSNALPFAETTQQQQAVEVFCLLLGTSQGRFTSEFGMGSGLPSPLWSPTTLINSNMYLNLLIGALLNHFLINRLLNFCWCKTSPISSLYSDYFGSSNPSF